VELTEDDRFLKKDGGDGIGWLLEVILLGICSFDGLAPFDAAALQMVDTALLTLLTATTTPVAGLSRDFRAARGEAGKDTLREITGACVSAWANNWRLCVGSEFV
jgi:hypothetical protein